MLSVHGTKNSAASSGQDAPWALGQLIDDLALNVSKALFSLDFKELANGATQALLYGVIRIDKGQIQFSGKMSTHSGFSTSRQTNQYIHCVVSQIKEVQALHAKTLF
jgi:hypothetical protein